MKTQILSSTFDPGFAVLKNRFISIKRKKHPAMKIKKKEKKNVIREHLVKYIRGRTK